MLAETQDADVERAGEKVNGERAAAAAGTTDEVVMAMVAATQDVVERAPAAGSGTSRGRSGHVGT